MHGIEMKCPVHLACAHVLPPFVSRQQGGRLKRCSACVPCFLPDQADNIPGAVPIDSSDVLHLHLTPYRA